LRYGRRRGWLGYTGKAWLPAPYSLHPERLREAQPLSEDPEATESLRARLLAQVVEDQVSQGAEVRMSAPHQVMLSRRRPVSHGLHAVLTLLTGGVWAPVWLIMAVARKDEIAAYEVDRWGHVWLREGGITG
jgi:hypothetical protein